MSNTERDKLAKVIEAGYGDDPTDCPYDHAPAIADAVIAAGYAEPRPVALPGRDELAFALFAADNRLMPPEQIRSDFETLKREQAAAGEPFYVEILADAAIEAFKAANP